MWERISRRLFAINPIAISQASWLNSSHKERISFLRCGSESAFYSVGANQLFTLWERISHNTVEAD